MIIRKTVQTFIAITLLFSFDVFAKAETSPLKNKTILIDPGHGVINFNGRVINPGRESRDGNMEHKLTMEIAQRLGKILKDSGANVFFTRTPKDYWRQAYTTIDDNRARALFANEIQADAFISIHCDWSPFKKVSGITTIYEKPNSRRLGRLVHTNLINRLGVKSRKLVCDSFTILDVAEVPTILVETGFLSNKKECKKLANHQHQTDIAMAISKGLKSYFMSK